jgi:tetrahydromethanopterin S-methyltransferase subunit G
MITIERMIQRINPGKWAELEEIDKRYDEIERKMGFPAKKRYQCIMGTLDQNTLVIERQWQSLAEMEATYEKVMALPEYQALGKEVGSIVASALIEIYTPLP